METLVLVLVCLTSSYLFAEIFKRIGMPKVLGPLFIGFLIGSTALRDNFVTGQTNEVIHILKELAIIFMLFFVGLKIDLKQFIKSSKVSFSVGTFSSVMSLVLGFIAVIICYKIGILEGLIPEGINVYLVAFVVGICFSVTAEAVAIEALEEFNLVTTKIGETIIEAGIVDDVIGIILISGLVTFIESSANPGAGITVLFLQILLYAILLYAIGAYLIPKLVKFVGKEHSRVDFFAIALIVTLFMAVLSLNLGLSSIIGALSGGVVIRHALLKGNKFENNEQKDITSMIEIITFGLLAPFFFIWIGLNTDISILASHPWITLIFIVVAFFGKIWGSVIGAKMAGDSTRDGNIIGWGMNMRGAEGFIVAALALSKGLISQELFSAIVFMGFVSTVVSPIVFKILVKNKHNL